MELDENAFAELVAERLKALGTTAFAVEKAHGLPPDAVRNVLRGAKKSGTPLNRAREICEALGLELYFGPKRELNPAPATIVDGERFATVARYDAAGAAGDGLINLDGPPVDHLAFSKRWLEQNGISAGDSVLINVKGDSMEPSIYDGDLVMIDRRKKVIRSGRIYVFRDGDTLRLKRFELIPGAAIVLRSDNPKHPHEHRIGHDMNAVSEGIIGEVVWSGHKWS